MKRFLKLFPLTLLFCLALTFGLVACGEKKSFSVTAEYNADAGSVVLSEEGKGSDGKYQEGASVTVTVTPNTGYEVTAFSVNGTAAALSGSNYTFTVKEDTKISVTFSAKTSDPDTPSDPSGPSGPDNPSDPSGPSGPDTPSDPSGPSEPDTPSDPSGPSEPDTPSDPSGPSEPDNPSTPDTPKDDHLKVELTCNFTSEMGSATLSAPADGKGYVKDELVTLTVTVNEGCLLEKVIVNDEEIELEAGEYKFKVRSDTTVTVSIRAIGYYKVTVEFDQAMGAVSVSPEANDDGAYVEGTKITLSVSVKYGYKLLSVKVDGSEVTLDEDGEYAFEIQKNVTVEVTFEKLEQYNVVFHFDTQMCSMSYLGINEEGKLGDISIQPNVATAFYEGEVTFTVIPTGGYELAWVEVNGEEIELSERSFTLDIGKALQDEEGEIHVAVFCGFVFTQRDSLAGEYELTDDVWYSFTLEEPAVFEFSATNYVAYAAFYLMTPVDGDGSTWNLDNKAPVWIFNVHQDNVNYAINTFEAGTYMARFTADTGDGVSSSKLTVTEIPYLDFELKNIRVGSLVSLNGAYKLYMGPHYLILKDKDGKTVETSVTRTTDDKGTHTYVAFGGKTYRLVAVNPAFHVDDTDDDPVATPVDRLIVSLIAEEGESVTEEINFRPDPLPSGVTIAKELAGTYTGVTYETDTPEGEYVPVEGELVVQGNTIKWGEKTITLLSSLDVCTTPKEIPEKVSVGYYENEVFFLFAILNDEVYQIGLISNSYQNQVTFSPKTDDEDDDTVTIDEQYWGTWKCLAANVQFSGYTLVISENGITVTDADGKPVACTVGTYQSSAATYPKLTIGTDEYYLTNLHGTLRMTLISQVESRFFNFVKQTTPNT